MNDRIISAHKLIEYAFSTPQKRNSIIENALQPPTFIVDTMYPDIERAVGHFLLSSGEDATRLINLDQTYQTREALTDHHEQRLLNAMDAISHVRDMRWPIPPECEIDLAQSLPNSMEICGLTVRIKPSVILQRRQSGSQDLSIGVVKPYFGKTFPLQYGEQEERGVLFATLLHLYAEQVLPFLGNADASLCFVADVFNEKVHFAAKRYKQRRKQIEALAQEIADRWEPIVERLKEKSPSRASSSGTR